MSIVKEARGLEETAQFCCADERTLGTTGTSSSQASQTRAKTIKPKAIAKASGRLPVLNGAARLHDLQLGCDLAHCALCHLVQVNHGCLACGWVRGGVAVTTWHGSGTRCCLFKSWLAPISSVTSLAMFILTPAVTTALQTRGDLVICKVATWRKHEAVFAEGVTC